MDRKISVTLKIFTPSLNYEFLMQAHPPYCNFEPDQSGYKNLTCEKWTLSKETILKKDEAIGWHQIIKTLRCFKCGRKWKIFEEYDSHHGYNHTALKEGQIATIWGKTHSFDSNE